MSLFEFISGSRTSELLRYFSVIWHFAPWLIDVRSHCCNWANQGLLEGEKKRVIFLCQGKTSADRETVMSIDGMAAAAQVVNSVKFRAHAEAEQNNTNEWIATAWCHIYYVHNDNAGLCYLIKQAGDRQANESKSKLQKDRGTKQQHRVIQTN